MSPTSARRVGAVMQGAVLGTLLLLALMRLMAILGWTVSFRYVTF